MESQQTPGTFTDEDIAFLDSQNNTGLPESNIYLTSKHGYIRNLDKSVKKRIEDIIQRVINPRFILDYYCGDCVKKAVLQVYGKLDEHKAAQAEPAAADTDLEIPPVELGKDAAGNSIMETISVEPPKSTRKNNKQ